MFNFLKRWFNKTKLVEDHMKQQEREKQAYPDVLKEGMLETPEKFAKHARIKYVKQGKCFK